MYNSSERWLRWEAQSSNTAFKVSTLCFRVEGWNMWLVLWSSTTQSVWENYYTTVLTFTKVRCLSGHMRHVLRSQNNGRKRKETRPAAPHHGPPPTLLITQRWARCFKTLRSFPKVSVLCADASPFSSSWNAMIRRDERVASSRRRDEATCSRRTTCNTTCLDISVILQVTGLNEKITDRENDHYSRCILGVTWRRSLHL